MNDSHDHVTRLPHTLPSALDLRSLNERVRAHATRLDWSAVVVAPTAALAALLANLDIVDDADALGLDTIPDPLQAALADALATPTRAAHSRITPIASGAPVADAQPTTAAGAATPAPTTDVADAVETTRKPDALSSVNAWNTAKQTNVASGGRPVAVKLWPSPATQPPLAFSDALPATPIEPPSADVLAEVKNPAEPMAPDETDEQGALDELNASDAWDELEGDDAPGGPDARLLTPPGSSMAVQPIGATLARPTEAELRRQLQHMVYADLLGPAGGDEEEVTERHVTERYIAGMLAPREARVRREAQDELAVSAGTLEPGDVDDADAMATTNTSLFPSSFGLSCTITGQAQALRVTARWGRYERARSETLTKADTGAPRVVWKRRPVRGDIACLPLREGPIEATIVNRDYPEVLVRGQARRLDGDWIVTLFLVNDQPKRKRLADTTWLFQAELALEAPDGAPIFCRHPITRTYQYRDESDQREERGLAMRYRNQTEFAVGHGVSVHATLAPGSDDTAVHVQTSALPHYETSQTFSPTPAEIPGLASLPLDMKALAAMDGPALATRLAPLPDAYANWMAAQATRINDPTTDLADHRQAVEEALAACQVTLGRIREGIALLGRDANAAMAFQFMNEAMWRQRVHGLAAEAARRGDQAAPRDPVAYDTPQQHSWRLFQLAFILLNLPGLTDLRHPDRAAAPTATADLLWFPTGGGKTEAYLGLTAYTLAMRRLQGETAGRSGAAGVAVLMRYTLRLLTLQQFQRAAALICACERVRRVAADQGDHRWGTTPFRLGLWVGANATPNWTDQSAEAIQQDHGHYRRASSLGGGGTPAQLTNCPWCGARINPGQHIKVSSFKQGTGRTIVYCGDPLGACPFSERNAPGEGLPVIVVDEDIYRQLPALVIATVDKFAQLPWKGPVGMLFGQVSGYCPRHGYRSPDLDDSDSHPARNGLPAVKTQPCAPLRPPDLIIQDELHLISGPLGALVGLYESVVDRLASWEVHGQRVRPKVIASTATVRRASEQVRALFLRQVSVFPPPGLDADDNFFARQRPPSDDEAGRLYLGVCAPGLRMKRALIRVYTAYLLAAQTLFVPYGELVDPWMTLVGYFNSMRELAGMRRLVDENVRTAMWNGRDHGFARRGPPNIDEMTSRKGSGDIPAVLEHMELRFETLPPGQTARKREPGRPRACEFS